MRCAGWDDRVVRLTRFSHSCVRLDVDGVLVVVGPGVWSEPEALTPPAWVSATSATAPDAKTVLTEVTDQVEIDVPRDRAGTFEPQIVRKRQRRLNGVVVDDVTGPLDDVVPQCRHPTRV